MMLSKKAAASRQSCVPLGDIGRDENGVVRMIEFMDYESNGLAPIVHVNKVAGIYRVGSLMKVTFALVTAGRAGMERAIERASLLWELPDVIAANEQFEWAFREWQKGTFETDNGGKRVRTQ